MRFNDQMARYSHPQLDSTCDLGKSLVASELPRKTLRFATARRIFAEGDPCAGVYVVRSGHVDLTLSYPRGDAIRVRVAGPEEVIGLASAMHEAPYCKTAVALEETVLNRFGADDVVRFLAAAPDRYTEALHFLCADADAMQRVLADAKSVRLTSHPRKSESED